MLRVFSRIFLHLPSPRNGRTINVDGHTLSLAAVTAAARYNANVELSQSAQVKEGVEKSRAVIAEKVEQGTSVYGVSTGFGGSGQSMQTMIPPRI